MDALVVLCMQLTRDLFAIAKVSALTVDSNAVRCRQRKRNGRRRHIVWCENTRMMGLPDGEMFDDTITF